MVAWQAAELVAMFRTGGGRPTCSGRATGAMVLASEGRLLVRITPWRPQLCVSLPLRLLSLPAWLAESGGGRASPVQVRLARQARLPPTTGFAPKRGLPPLATTQEKHTNFMKKHFQLTLTVQLPLYPPLAGTGMSNLRLMSHTVRVWNGRAERKAAGCKYITSTVSI